MHHKRLGKDTMRRAEALNTWLFYDHVLQQKIPSTIVSINLVSNYNLVVHNIASIVLQRAGVSIVPICLTFTILQDLVH
eukprot:5459353-Ditylum_brightwellii.AAC.2